MHAKTSGTIGATRGADGVEVGGGDGSDMAKPQPVRIEGFNAFRRELGKMDKGLRSGLSKEMKEIAKPIEADARKRYRKLHPRARPTKGSQRGIRASTKRGGAAINLGSPRYPYLQGQEWGSGQYPQFPPWIPDSSGRGSEGRFYWPAIEDGLEEVEEKVGELIDRVSKEAFPDRSTNVWTGPMF